MNSIVCLKWGDKYSSEYVNILYSMVKRNTTIPYEFYCITEDTSGLREEIKTLPLYDEGELMLPENKGWWYKLMLFKERPWGLQGRILFLDLDVIIVDNIDDLMTQESSFTIIKEWHRPGFQSSVFCLDIGTHEQIWDDFISDSESAIRHFHGDQEWIYHCLKVANFYPFSWIQSFKYHCKDPHRPSEGAKIISFHGRPNPHEAHKGYGKYPPALWAPKYWRE